MISETELSDLLAEAAATIPDPPSPARVLDGAAPGPALAPHFRHPNRVLLGALSVAAVVVVAVVLALRPSPPHTILGQAHEAISAGGAESFAVPTPVEKSSSQGLRIPTTPSPVISTFPAAAGRQKITASGTLSLTVRTAALRGVVGRLQALASSLGGYVTQSDVALSGSQSGGTVVLGVPAASFSRAIAQAEKLGSVHHLSTSADDVTGQVEDLAARVSALVSARTQFEALLPRAGTIPALLAVENQITDVQSQIEELQSEQRTLANKVSYSSLSVTLAPSATHHAPPPSGFAKAWHDALGAFVGGIRSLVAASGSILFGLLLAAVIGALVFVLGRRLWPIVRRLLL